MPAEINPMKVRALITALSVYENQRVIGRFDCYDDASLKFCILLISELGLKYKIKPVKETKDKSGAKPGRAVYMAKTERDISKMIRYYSENLMDDNIILGKFYGYPDCCIKKFARNRMLNHKESDIEILCKTVNQSRDNIFSFYVNRFSPYKPILHLPHSFNCRPSIEIGKYNMELLKSYDKKIHDYAARQLQCCVLLYRNSILLIDNFLIRKNYVLINSFAKYSYLMNSALTSDGIKRKNKALDSYDSYLKFWHGVLSRFKTGESYEIKFKNSGGIKIIIFS